MTTLASKPSPLVPTLPDAVNKRLRHPVTDLRGGDQLFLTAKVLGFAKGSKLAIYGFCILRDADGTPYQVRAYVRGGANCVSYAQREAKRYRFENQEEKWFGSFLMYLTEIDLTDYADCLRLKRQPEPLVRLLYPEVEYSHAQAA